MPQLDKLAFGSQIFWLLFIFIFSYYFFLQICLLRLKFNLGFKRFFFQVEKYKSFYEVSKLYFSDGDTARSKYLNLLFFFDSYNFSIEGNGLSAPADHTFLDLSENAFLRALLNSPLGSFFEAAVQRTISFLSIFKQENNFILILFFNKDFSTFIFDSILRENEILLNDLLFFSKDLNSFYSQYFPLVTHFFKILRFYVYEILFSLFFDFFNSFLKTKNILYFFKLFRNNFSY